MLKYINRKQDTFCVQKLKNEKGSYNYRVIKYNDSLSTEDLLENLSPQYELYERPFDARVSIRKKFTSLFSSEEIEIVNEVLIAQELEEFFIIDTQEKELVIYLSSLTKKDKEAMNNHDMFHRAQWYHDKLKVVKSENGNFQIQRFSNLLQFMGWITIESGTNLKELITKYTAHINKDSLLNFWEEKN